MRISELAKRTGVPVSAVKYYQREGMLPDGERTAPNQVSYGVQHEQRIRLIRALLDVGGLSIASTKEVVAALDRPDAPVEAMFGVAQRALAASRLVGAPATAGAHDEVVALTETLGWHAEGNNPGYAIAARAIDGLRAIGCPPPAEYLAAYAAAAATAAGADLGMLALRQEPADDAAGDEVNPDQVAELMVVGSVLGEPLFAGLRQLAQEHIANEHRHPPLNRNEP